MCYSLLNNENVGRIINSPKDSEILLVKLNNFPTLTIKGVYICFGVDKQNKYSLHFLSLRLKKCKEKRIIKNKITQNAIYSLHLIIYILQYAI